MERNIQKGSTHAYENILYLKKSFKLTWQYSKSFYLVAIISSVINSSLLTLPSSVILQHVINRIMLNKISVRTIIMSLAFSFLYEMLILPVFQISISYLKQYTLHRASLQYQGDVYKKIFALKADMLENSNTFELYRRISNRGVTSLTGFPIGVISILTGVISTTIFIILFSRYNLWLAISLVPLCICQYLLNRKIDKKKIAYDKVQEILYAKMDGINRLFLDRETLCEIKVFNSFPFLDGERMRFWEKSREEYRKQAKMSLKNNLFAEIVGQGTYYILYLAFAFFTFNKSVLLGDFLFVVNNLPRLIKTLSSTISSISNLLIKKEFIKEYEAFLALVEESNGTEEFDNQTQKNFLINNIVYGYSANRNVINSLSMEINEGQKICIFGDNGAGKTTLVKLICGLYEDYGGKIIVQNNDLRSYKRRQVKNLYSFAMQETPRYPFTMKQNVCWGNCFDQEIFDEVCSISGIDEIADELKDGVNTYLNKEYDLNGVDLSIGQWQKLLIARVMYRNKEILIFDEPTSALDPLAEQEFIDNLLTWYKNNTVIIISHRMTFASIADQVYVMKNGAVVEAGTPVQLLNKKGVFYDYYNLQKNLYV